MCNLGVFLGDCRAGFNREMEEEWGGGCNAEYDMLLNISCIFFLLIFCTFGRCLRLILGTMGTSLRELF